MKKIIIALPLAMSFGLAKGALAADEIHWTITGQNSVTVNWHGTNNENTITYGLDAATTKQAKATQPNPMPFTTQGSFWEAKLTGLKENTTYTYSIGNGSKATFRTPPVRGAANFTIFAEGITGDTNHYFNTGVIQDIIASGKPAFVVGLGDLSLGSLNGQAAVHQHFNDVMAWSKNAAYMPVLGDLDWRNTTSDNVKSYKGRFNVPNSQTSPNSPQVGGEDWYWFDYGNTRFITLPEPFTGAWADWQAKADKLMAQAQADSRVKFVVTFVHRPAYSSGHYAGSTALKGILDNLGDRYSKYVLNVNSHSANYERSTPQHGVMHVTAGTGGRNLMQDGSCLWLTCTKPAWSAFRAMHLGALKLSFTSTGINGSFICGPAGGGMNDVECKKGEVVDKFTINARNGKSISNTPSASSSVPLVSSATAGMTMKATVSTAACTKVNLSVSSLISDGGYSYRLNKVIPGTPADNVNSKTRSKLRLFENGVEMGPAHSQHSDIRTLGKGRFSHWSAANGSSESVRFSATNNTNPKTNGKTYAYCVDGATTGTSGDTQAPSVPANLTSTVASSSQINVFWKAASDNVGVAGYNVYRNGSLLTSLKATSIPVTGLAAGTTYSFNVAAYDAAGNVSAKSATISAKTSAATSTAPPATTACASSPSSSLVVNVQDKGAKGNGSANDTAAIQAAVDQVAGTGGTVYVPNGTYMVDASKRIFVKSNMTFRMASGATLKVIPNSLTNSTVLRVMDIANVNIIGGTIQGDTNSHSSSSENYGHLIGVYNADNIVVEGVTLKEAAGDGVYVGLNASKVAVCSIVADNNGRHGLTVTSGDGVVIKNSVFKNGKKLRYSLGVDIEPNQGGYINNVKITNSQFLNNYGGGMAAGYPYASGGGVTNLVIDGNTMADNGKIGGAAYAGIILSNQNGCKILNNTVRNNVQDGITLYNKTRNCTVSGNTITGSGIGNNVDDNIGNGILLWDSGTTGNTVTNNTLSGNKVNIMNGVSGNVVSPNTLR